MTEKLILVGGGLANGLIACRLKARRPDLEIVLLERGDRLGGEHTWSFFESDLSRDQRAWIAPFVTASWDAYDVRFPRRARRVGNGYRSISSSRFHDVLTAALGGSIRLNTDVAEISPNEVRLRSGETIAGAGVIDGRGEGAGDALDLGFQKFVGLELDLASPHGLDAPVIMDATVAQSDGYRFVYVLPFAERRVLIEDTYYSDGGVLDETVVEARIHAYAKAAGWKVSGVARRESGVLPIALGGDIEAFWAAGPEIARSGLRAALFHPVTGYSLPDAVRFADAVAGLSDLSGSALFAFSRDWSRARWQERAYYRLLNRMLFRAAAPDERYRVLERFYGLSDALIARFYAGQSTWGDKLRVLAGKPPVPIGRAIACLPEARGAAK